MGYTVLKVELGEKNVNTKAQAALSMTNTYH